MKLQLAADMPDQNCAETAEKRDKRSESHAASREIDAFLRYPEPIAEVGQYLTSKALRPGYVPIIMDAGQTKPHFSIPSLIAIGAAIGSFFMGAFGGFMLAIVAIVFGILGMLLAMAPSVRGGFVSMLSLFAGGVGIILAIVKVFV